MGFLSKHYEKIILASFLLIFITALVYLIMVFSKSTEITEEDLIIEEREADYASKFNLVGEETAKEEKNKKYAYLKNLSKEQSWTTTAKRNKISPVETDLLKPISAARCPGCKKVIPLVYFEKQDKCILCGFDLKPPEKPKTPVNNDVDKDGMDDKWERQNELNPDSPSDKMQDKDEDGYPNYIEYKAVDDHRLKPNDPTSHPPLAWRLALLGIKKTLIPMQLFNVMKNNSEDPAKWLVQIKTKSRSGRWKDGFKKLNETIKVGRDVFKIIDVKFIEKEKYNPRLKMPMKMNVSEIVIKNTVNEVDKPIKVEMKKAVYENLVKIGLEDVINEKRYSVKVGDVFTAGDDIVGRTKYEVISLDGRKSVTIQEVSGDKKGPEYVIKKTSVLDEKIAVETGIDAEKAKEDPGMMMPFDPEGRSPRRKTRRKRSIPPPGRFDPRL